MEQQFDFEVLVRAKRKKRKKAWKRILSVMMCLVVFCTTYMLILPAITKENTAFCGIEEHTHGEACYEKVLLCENHVHTQACYESHSELICTETAGTGHVHGEACSPVTEMTLTCGQEEGNGHVHTEDCSRIETRLICGQEESAEHTHDDGCSTTVTVNVCGLEESAGHRHDDSCYTETTTYGCGMDGAAAQHEHGEACYETTQQQTCALETTPGHEHTDACYEQKLICETPEHTHETACFADLSADLETAARWEKTLPDELTGIYADDVLAVAESQLGYRESTRNYIVNEENSIKGYTRYGAWYGIPYGDWCAMFVSFCLHYAGVEEMPLDANCPNWIKKLEELDLYKEASEYIPKPGDIIFFDWEVDGVADHVGLVEKTEDTDVITIEGNSSNSVLKCKYDLHDVRIAGYGMLVEKPAASKEGQVRPEDVTAWASLIGPDGQILNETPVETAAPKTTRSNASTYALRKSRTTNQDSAKAMGTPLDLTPYINSVTMYDSAGNVLPSGTVVTEGDLIEFRIDYTLTGQQLGVMNGQNITIKTNTLTYSIPGNFKVIRNDSGNIANSAGQTVGSFLIDSASGIITMTFSDAYVTDNAVGVQIQGNISFFSAVTRITDADLEDQKYTFTDDITLGVIIKEETEVEGSLQVEKDVVGVAGDQLTYQVKVTSTEGTYDSITITDRMAPGLTFKEGLGVLENGSTVNLSFNPASDRQSFTMTLPQMEAGDTYTLRYTCTADIDLLDTDMTARNTATVTSKDSLGKELKDETTVGYTFEMLKKNGIDNGNGTIFWIITINQANVDISGWTLTDRIGNENYTGTVTIKDSKGSIVAQDTKLPYTFPAGSDDTYTVNYTTAYDYGDGDMVSNKAILEHDGTEITVLSGVAIGTPVTKTGTIGEIIQGEDGTYLLPITWTITIDTSKGPIPAGSVLQDLMEDWNSGEMYMTYAQLMAAYEAVEAELIRVGSGKPTDFVAGIHIPGMGYNSALSYDYAELTGNANGARSNVYENFSITINNAVPKGEVLTFTYQAYGTFENNTVAGAMYTNQFNISQMYNTKGTVELSAGAVKATKYPLHTYDPDVHGEQDWYWGQTSWVGDGNVMQLPYNELHDAYLAWAIELSVPLEYWGKGNIVLYEDLPEGVTAKDLKLSFNSNVPTSTLRLQDMVPGETYKWEFTLYTAEQLFNWDRTNGQLISIDIKYTEAGDLEISIPGIIFETMSQYAALENTRHSAADQLNEWFGYLYVITQIDEDFEWTPKNGEPFVYMDPFQNQFTLKDEGGNVLDVGSQTTMVTKDERDGVVRKEATTDSNNIINYSVVLNSYGKDLIEHSGILAIHDELTYTSTDEQPIRLRLVPGSVTLHEVKMNADGTYTKLGEVNTNYNYNETSTEQYGTTSWKHTIDLTVPDSKALLLEYAYKATGVKSVTHSVANVCTISGVAEGSVNGDSIVEIEVKGASAQANTAGVMLYKVDANSDGVFLKNAVFNIYIWNEELQKYIIVHHPESSNSDFITNDSGMILLDGTTMAEEQFAYNTAYYIVEKESPEGYFLSPEPYYFYIAHNDTEAYPPCGLDNGYNSQALATGDIIYRENVSETTGISIEKYWRSYNGDSMIVGTDKVSGVTLELWQMLEGDPDSAAVLGTYTMTPDADGNWSLTITGLPRSKEENGLKGADYLYYIKEVGVDGFYLESVENNAGINSGIIKLVNREVEGYELPQTGGSGTQMYTTVGLLLIAFSAVSLLYMHKKRRREEENSP